MDPPAIYGNSDIFCSTPTQLVGHSVGAPRFHSYLEVQDTCHLQLSFNYTPAIA